MRGDDGAHRRGPVAHALLCVLAGVAGLEALVFGTTFGIAAVMDPAGLRGGIVASLLLVTPAVAGLGAVTWGALRAYRAREGDERVRKTGWIAAGIGGVIAAIPFAVVIASESGRGPWHGRVLAFFSLSFTPIPVLLLF